MKWTLEPTRPESKRKLMGLTVSLMILVAGMFWTWHVGQQSGRYYHELGHLHEGLAELRDYVHAHGGVRS